MPMTASLGASGWQVSPIYPVSGDGSSTSFDVNAASDLGDSYRENGYFMDAGTGVNVYRLSRGFVQTLNMVLGDPWRKLIPRCKTGTTTAQWIASDLGVMTNGGLTQALTDNSYDVLVAFPTNDVNTSVASATTIANLTTIYDAIRAAGKRPWPTLGGIVNTWSAGQIALADAINTACVAYAQTNGLPWVDDRAICDPGARTISAALAYDSTTHPNAVANMRSALAQKARLATFLLPAIRKASRLTALNANPALGSLTAGIPASWTAAASNSGVPTRVAAPGAEGGWQTTFTAALVSGYDGLTLTATLAALGLAVGDQVQMVVTGRIVSATSGVSPRAYLSFGASSTYVQARGNSRTSPDAYQLWSQDSSQNSFTVGTPVVPIPASTTNLTLLANLEADNGAVVTAILTSIQVVKVV